MYDVHMTTKDLGISPAMLEAALRRAKMSPADLARATGVSPSTISLILNGKHKTISAVNLAKIAIELGVSLDYLMELSGEPEPTPLMLGDLLLELTQVARKLSSRRQRDLLLLAQAYLEEHQQGVDRRQLIADLMELIEQEGGERYRDQLIDMLEASASDDAPTPLLGDDQDRAGEGDK
jgi:transcriptional regulator with XRE-family HTH domain